MVLHLDVGCFFDELYHVKNTHGGLDTPCCGANAIRKLSSSKAILIRFHQFVEGGSGIQSYKKYVPQYRIADCEETNTTVIGYHCWETLFVDWADHTKIPTFRSYS